MADLQVTGIVKRDHHNPHERIAALCGPGWGQKSEDGIIGEIKAGINSYYVVANGVRTIVITAVHEGREYLKTTADGYSPDNLLSLPNC